MTDQERTWFKDPCSCPVMDAHGDGCSLSTDTTRHLCDHCEAHAAVKLDVKRLARAMAEADTGLVYYGTDDPVDWAAEAAKIAYEYARLSVVVALTPYDVNLSGSDAEA